MERDISRLGLIIILAMALVGCGSAKTYAPVVDGWKTSTARSSSYMVQKGDTLYSIAWGFGMDYRDLARANNIASPYSLRIGQRLSMREVSSPASSPTKRVVRYASTSTKPIAARPITPQAPSKQVRAVPHEIPRQPARPVGNKPVRKWLWPAQGKVAQGYSKKLGGNRGINIAGRYGEPVRASAAGQVVYSGSSLRGYGNMLIIKHNNSYLSAYAFNRKLLVKEGADVKAGQKIALMGRNDKGRAEVHFEIRRNGRPINPLSLLRKG